MKGKILLVFGVLMVLGLVGAAEATTYVLPYNMYSCAITGTNTCWNTQAWGPMPNFYQATIQCDPADPTCGLIPP